jgi:peroxiredoxin
MSEKSPFLKTHLWSVILIILVIAMGVEIMLLVQENQKLRSALTARRGPFTVLNPEEKVPPLVGMDQKGEEVKVEYPSSQRTVLFWFSAACPSCEHNVEFWKEVYKKHGSEGYRFFGATTAGEGKIGEFLSKFQLEFPVLTVSDYSLLDEYKVEVIPQTMLIDERGFVLKVWPGPLSDNYKMEIEEMMTSSPSS